MGRPCTRSYSLIGCAIAAVALFIAPSGCSNKGPSSPVPPPKLDSPRIAFISDRTGTVGIHLYNPSNGQIIRVSLQGTYDKDPAISPNGTRIAFVYPSPIALELTTMAVNGADRRLCSGDRGFDAYGPHWSPDSRRIAFTRMRQLTGEHDVFTIFPSGVSLLRITKDSLSTALAWSPDGSRILFVHQPPDNFRDFGPSYLRDALPSGDSVRTLWGPENFRILGADYSPDGSRIVLSYRDAFWSYIAIANADGTNKNAVALDSPSIEGLGPPSWSPDGALIVFSGHISTATADLFTVTPDLSPPHLLLGGAPADLQPTWGPKP